MMFLLILGIVAWISLALWPAFIAKRKGYSFVVFLLLAVLISFLLALLIAVLLEDKTVEGRAADRAAEKALRKEEGLE